MNRPACLAVGLLVCGLMARGVAAQDFSGQQPELPAGPGGLSIPSAASSVPGSGISVGMKNSTDASQFKPQITAFVQAQVAKIATDDPAAQRTSREALIAECTPGASTSYLSIYAAEVNSAVLALLNKNPLPPLRVRLNLAVLVESVAHITRDDGLRPCIIKLVADPGDPVALWGIRAARSIMAPAAKMNPAAPDTLIAPIVAAVKAHPKAGYIAEEAYRTLSLEGEGVALGGLNNSLNAVLQGMLDELSFRIKLYQKSIPDDPEAEEFAARFFSANFKNNLNNVQKQQIIQSLTDLITVIGAQAGSAPKAVLEQMVDCLRITSQSLSVITQEPPGSPLERLMHLVPSNGGAAVVQQTQPVYAELKARFTYLQPAPPVQSSTRPSGTTQRTPTMSTPPAPPAAAAAAR